MSHQNDKDVQDTDYTPMWGIYLNYLRKLLPWEQRTLVLNRNAILEMTQLEDKPGAKGGKLDANRSGKRR